MKKEVSEIKERERERKKLKMKTEKKLLAKFKQEQNFCRILKPKILERIRKKEENL